MRAQQLTFSDIFNVDLPTVSGNGAGTGVCNPGFVSVNAGYGSYKAPFSGSNTYYHECLKRASPVRAVGPSR